MKKLKGKPEITKGEEIAGLDPENFSVFYIEFDKKNNLRLQYDEAALRELAESIRSEGQLQPVGVERKRNENQRHHLVYGYRRFIAITDHLNRDRIRVVFVDGENRDVIQLTENIHRTDLSDIEIARSLVAIKERTGETNAELAARLNKSEDWIKDKIFHAKTIDSLATESKENQETEGVLTHPAQPEETEKAKGVSTHLEEDGHKQTESPEGVTTHPELEKLTTSHVRETRGLGDEKKREILLDAAENKRTAREVRARVNAAKADSITETVTERKSSLSEKDRKRGDKLALQLKTIRQTKEKLEEKLKNTKVEEKRLIKELKTLGQPELFGVEL